MRLSLAPFADTMRPRMDGTEGTLSSAEQRFESLRRKLGLLLAPLVFITLWFLPIAGLTPPAHNQLAVMGLVMTLWMTEAIPLPATALLGPFLCVLVGIGPVSEVFKSFANPILFLYLGSFLVAEAMQRHGLNRRIAFRILSLPGVGESPTALMAAFGCVTAFISMWMSNTATTAMMLPIGLAILQEMARMESRRTGREVRHTDLPYGTGLMLMAAFASSIGGLATPVGTPPNLIGIAQIQKELGVKISFFQWMSFGVPLMLALLAFLVWHMNRTYPAAPGALAGGRSWIAAERSKLGAITIGETNVLLAFGITVTLWLTPGIAGLVQGMDAPVCRWFETHLPESMAALAGALLLFLLPVNPRKWEFTLTWQDATRIDWGTILLFGGGLALGQLMKDTGLANWIGKGLAGLSPTSSVFGLTVVFTLVGLLVSETTSNLASATMVVPIAIAVAQAAGVDPLQPALAACLGASMGFMLPISTPPNAIVYGSGCVPLPRMIRSGLALDVAGAIAVILVVTQLVPRVLR